MVSFQGLPSVLILAVVLVLQADAFTPSSWGSKMTLSDRTYSRSKSLLQESEDPQAVDELKKEATKLSLEEKMAKWEATEEEIKASTLGGVVPERSDSFDVGLYIAFPFMVIGCFLFLAFPLIADKIDVSSVGPPPTS